MSILKYYENEIPKLKETAITIGKFDGIHLGHLKLIKTITSINNEGLKSVVFTFNTEQNGQGCITTENEKKDFLKEEKIDYLISYSLDNTIKNMTGEEFIEEILIKRLDAKVIVVGEDFRFGYNRTGDINLLRKMSDKYGYKLIICNKIKVSYDSNTDVSSTLIKKWIVDGCVKKANCMLGYPYFIQGTVISGQQLGRTIGFPTANISLNSNKIIPCKGVYAVKVAISDEEYKGIANIGNKPTVGDSFDKGLEVHIIDFDKDIYNKTIKVKFIECIREEKKFGSVELLKEQISADLICALEILN